MIIVPIDSNGYIIEYWIMGIQQYFSYIMEVSLNDVESQNTRENNQSATSH
jgi:hypothetical protein